MEVLLAAVNASVIPTLVDTHVLSLVAKHLGPTIIRCFIYIFLAIVL